MKKLVKVIAVLVMATVSSTVFADVNKLLDYVPEGADNVSVLNVDNVHDFIPFVEVSIENAFKDNEHVTTELKKVINKIDQFNQFLVKYNFSFDDISAVCGFGKIKSGLVLVDSTVSAQQLESILGLIQQESQYHGDGEGVKWNKSTNGNYTVYTIELDEKLKQKLIAEMPKRCHKSNKANKVKEQLKDLKAYVSFLDAGTIVCSTDKKAFLAYLDSLEKRTFTPAVIDDRTEITNEKLIFYHYSKSTDGIQDVELLESDDVKLKPPLAHKQFAKAVKSTKMYLLFESEKNEFVFKNDVILDNSTNATLIANMAMTTSSFMKMHNLDLNVQSTKRTDGTSALAISLKGDMTFAEKVYNAVKLMAGHHPMINKMSKKNAENAKSTDSPGLTIRKEN